MFPGFAGVAGCPVCRACCTICILCWYICCNCWLILCGVNAAGGDRAPGLAWFCCSGCTDGSEVGWSGWFDAGGVFGEFGSGEAFSGCTGMELSGAEVSAASTGCAAALA